MAEEEKKVIEGLEQFVEELASSDGVLRMLSPGHYRRAIIHRFLTFSPMKCRRIAELVRLFQVAESQKEQVEIIEVLEEVLFRDPADMVAIPVEEM